MKLAEALLLRADLQKKMVSLKDRISRTSLVQEGDKPVEDPANLLKEVTRIAAELERTIFQVNSTNLESTLNDGRSLTEALVQREVLVQRHATIRSAVESATRPPERYGAKEIRWVTTVDVPKLQKQVDDLGKQLRELNGVIQEANWVIDLKT